MNKKLYSVAEFAKITNHSKFWVYTHLQNHDLQSRIFKVPKKRETIFVCIYKNEISKFIKGNNPTKQPRLKIFIPKDL